MLKIAMVLASVMVLACAGPASAAELVPRWTVIGKLPKAERALARRVVADQIGEDQDSDSGEMNKFVRNEARGGYLSPGTGGSLFLVRMPSFSNCGEITLSIFGSPGQSGERPVLMDQECLSGVRFMVSAKGGPPDIIATIGEFADRIHRWNGTEWHAEETIEGPALRQPAKGNVRDLRRLAGTRDLLSVLQATGMRGRLKAGLGVHYPILLRNLSVRAPLVYKDGCLIAEGLAPHSGGSEEAVLATCSNGALHIALLTNDSVIVHSPVTGAAGLPAAMRPTIEHWSGGRPARWIGAK